MSRCSLYPIDRRGLLYSMRAHRVHPQRVTAVFDQDAGGFCVDVWHISIVAWAA